MSQRSLRSSDEVDLDDVVDDSQNMNEEFASTPMKGKTRKRKSDIGTPSSQLSKSPKQAEVESTSAHSFLFSLLIVF